MNTTLVIVFLTGFTAAAQQPLDVKSPQPADSKVVGPSEGPSPSAETRLLIGFLDVAVPADPTVQNGEALKYALTQGSVTRIRPIPAGGWKDAADAWWAPEEADVVWFHQADDPAAAALPESALADLGGYLEMGGVLLLSGAAGRLVNDLGIESTPVRVLAPTAAPYVSGINVLAQHRQHDVFSGLDPTQTILLTSFGGNALADFYGTAGPHGELLAEGNAGVGERPLVEYSFGAGRVIFVGWRLPDFASKSDAYRANLERLFGNLLKYLAKCNTNRGRLVPPKVPCRYRRVLGVPVLLTDQPVAIAAEVRDGREWTAVTFHDRATPDAVSLEDAVTFEDLAVSERNIQTAENLRGVTLLSRSKPVSQYVALRSRQRDEDDRRDAEKIKGLVVTTPRVKTVVGPLQPLQMPELEQSVLLGRSPFMAPGEGLGDIQPAYEPLEDGGFRIAGSTRRLNRPIAHGQNRVWTGDVPVFRLDTTTGNGAYASDRVFPLWPRPDIQSGSVYPCMGTLRLAVPGSAGQLVWLDAVPEVTTTFRPGYTE